MATLSLIGIFNYNEHIFDDLVFPEGIDKEIAVNEILTRSGEFEILYPDATFLTAMITHWGKKHFRTFDKWVKALAIDYDPLNNYDRTEETCDEERKKSGYKTSADYTDKRTANLEDKRTANLTDTNSQTVSSTVDHDVAAYDSATLTTQSKDTTNAGTNQLQQTGTDTLNHTGTDETRHAGTISDVDGSEQLTNIHTARMFGNIGVTTSQQMLQAEIDVQRFNIYSNIADLFIDEFCILVY